MSAKTKFFICGKCGFKNHPRHPRQGRASSEPDIDDSKCEQCGSSRDEPESFDYQAS